MTTTVATTVACCDAETGDVILVLQEQVHSVLKRNELSLVEALCDMELESTHFGRLEIAVDDITCRNRSANHASVGPI